MQGFLRVEADREREPCRAIPCHAMPAPSPMRSLCMGFPKPSLTAAVLALPQALLCSDLAICSHRKGKPGPWRGFPTMCSRSGTRLEPVGCSVSVRHLGVGSTFQGKRGFPTR